MSEINQLQESEKKEGIPLGEILFKLLPYWPGFVLLILLFLTGTWFYLRYTLPVYQTTASILIKDDKKAGSLDPLEAFDLFGGKKSVDNEVEILRSKTLMQEVVKNLHLYAPITEKGRVLTSNAYLNSPVRIIADNPDSILPAFNVPFDFNPESKIITFEEVDYPLNQFVETPFGKLKFLLNEKYIKPKGNNLSKDHSQLFFSLRSIKSAANSMLDVLSVSPSSKQSTVIILSLKTHVPRMGEDVLNELLKVYNQAAILDKNVLAANTLKFVENRLDFVVKDLDSVENSLQQFKAQNKIVDISAQGEIYLRTVAENDQKISEINMQLAMLDEVEKYVTRKGDLSGVVPIALSESDPVLMNLLTNLSDLELKYEQTRRVVPENNPAVTSLLDGINKLKPGILQNIKSQRNNLVAAKNNINGTNERFSSILRNIPEKERELLGISRQQNIKNNIYTFLLQKREETALSFASAVADSRIIDSAETSNAPVSPQKLIIYLVSLFISIAIGIGIIYAKETMNRSIQDKSEIEKQTDIPILGDVSFDRSKAPLVIGEGKRSFIAEQFRHLRTSLTYLGINESHKRILVTSSIPGEGKSFISLNLGISLSLTDKRVAVLELDLRKPKLSQVFNVSRTVGISNYLIGKKSISEIKKDTGIENLVLLPSGPIPPNPSELISNGKLEELLTSLEKDFDFIIIDTAPTSPVTDAFILSPMMDLTLFIVRHDYTPKIFIQKLKQFKDSGKLKNPAVIYNGVRGKGIMKYGYGYGYGYTEDQKNIKWWKKLFSKYS